MKSTSVGTILMIFANVSMLILLTRALSTIAAEDDRALGILNQSRLALGGDSTLKTLESLSAKGKMRRVLGEMDQSGDLEWEMLLPDKYRREETVTLPMGPELAIVAVLNGSQAWHDMRDTMGGPRPPFMRRSGADSDNLKSMEFREMRADFVRQLLALTLTAPDSFPLEFSHGGKAQSADGEADIVDVKGPDQFSARLFLSESSHLPLMISYQGMVPRFARMMPFPPPGQMSRNPSANPPDLPPEPMPKPELSEIQIVFDDYRAVSGIQLPHRIAKSIQGKVFEEWQIVKYKVNPSLNPARFEKK
jgi:hypothetical protein